MTPLAIIAKQAGVTVSGSDIADVFITDASLKKAGITPLIGFDASHVGDVDLVITTGAHGGFDNIEVKSAKEKDIPVVTQGEAVGIFMRGEIFGKEQKGISVFGSHGKTTTTAMVATIFTKEGLDPSFLIGTSDVASLGESAHYGKGDYFIAEADEYATEPTYDKTPKLFWQHPEIAICTNIELDHPDIYESIDTLVSAFTTFINKLPVNGVLICFGDDKNIEKMLQNYTGKKVTYGLEKKNDYVIKNIQVTENKTTFQLGNIRKKTESFILAVAGEHNVFNAVAAVLAGISVGISLSQIQKGISAYTGSKRRLEYVGRLKTGAFVYDDYAHHPTEIAASLTALKKSHPDKKLVCVFQAHTYSRTKVLFKEFSKAFTLADSVVLTDIYSSQREAVDPTVSMEDLVLQINLNGQNALYLPKPIDVVKYIQENAFTSDTLLVTMGAGDIYKIAQELDITYG